MICIVEFRKKKCANQGKTYVWVSVVGQNVKGQSVERQNIEGQNVEQTMCRTDNVSKGQSLEQTMCRKYKKLKREKEKLCMTSSSLTIKHLVD